MIVNAALILRNIPDVFLFYFPVTSSPLLSDKENKKHFNDFYL